MPRRGADLQDNNMQKERVLMITTDTTGPDIDEATETDAEWRERRRERHQQLMSSLEVLTDLVADAGPLGQVGGDHVDIKINIGLFDGTMTEQIGRLHALATTLGAQVEERPFPEYSSVHYNVQSKPADGIEISAFVVAGGVIPRPDEIDEAKAAHAALIADRVTISYEIEHDPETAAEVTAALSRHGIDAVADIAGLDHGHPTVTVNDDRIYVDCGDFGGGIPALARCVGIEAYAATIAAYARGDFDGPCPARPDFALRAIHTDGTVVTAYACEPYHDDLGGDLTDDGFTAVRLDADFPIPTGIACGHRTEPLGGAA
jgi:hypothetical protein